MDIQKKRKHIFFTKKSPSSSGEAVFVSEKEIVFRNSYKNKASGKNHTQRGAVSVACNVLKSSSVRLWRLGKTFDSKRVPVFFSSDISSSKGTNFLLAKSKNIAKGFRSKAHSEPNSMPSRHTEASLHVPLHWKEDEKRREIFQALSAVSFTVKKSMPKRHNDQLQKTHTHQTIGKAHDVPNSTSLQCELNRAHIPQVAFEKYARISGSTEAYMHDLGSIDAGTFSRETRRLSLSRNDIYELFRNLDTKDDVGTSYSVNAEDVSDTDNDMITKRMSFRDFFSGLGRAQYFTRTFAFSAVLIFGLIVSTAFVSQGFMLRGQVLGVSKDGYDDVLLAVKSVKEQDFSVSGRYFEDAHENFSQASRDIDDWAGIFGEISANIPFFSAISSGKNALSAAGHLALAGKYLNDILASASALQNPFGSNRNDSMIPIFRNMLSGISSAHEELVSARDLMNEVQISDIPENKRDKFLLLKNNLPYVIENMENIAVNGGAFMDMLGANGPRKYVFLFQNNHEIRPTGGFIGSYGFLDMHEGAIRKFFVNGIFDPDGQLSVNIVPPQPVQKISAAWSLHDSNWFPDFPLSAEKAIFFYEKTGGPTVDGVIAVTPEFLRRLLEITGPIYLEQHHVTVDAGNFIEKIQNKVEVDYDISENKPKQILSDLAPILLEKTIQLHDGNTLFKMLDAIYSAAREKHILLYSRNETIQKLYSQIGWSGEVRVAPADFFEVVNANINGFKTDGVVEESVNHSAEIQVDGSIIDTVSITRKHTGGDTKYDWWNRVNADFMRIYVPEGSQLISVSGQTREIVSSPLDYDALGFKRDDDIERIERSAKIDPESGTRIYSESGKTVFGNWVYVSPKEDVTVTYVYKLPFSARELSSTSDAPSYSLLVQKQSGTLGDRFESIVHYPSEWKTVWNHGYKADVAGTLSWIGDLKTDMFLSTVFQSEIQTDR